MSLPKTILHAQHIPGNIGGQKIWGNFTSNQALENNGGILVWW